MSAHSGGSSILDPRNTPRRESRSPARRPPRGRFGHRNDPAGPSAARQRSRLAAGRHGDALRDLAAAIVANRHSRRPVVTAAFDDMAFLAPVMVGQVALIHARMTLVDRSSMEIRVDVVSEDVLTGERRKTGTAFVTFVALDPVTKRPAPVPPLVLETEEEKAEHVRALERRRLRLERRKAHANE
ncbi:MAG: acyl-CoA thioesterase [Candidatus Eisenbacteria bacterium]|nr:acyl-CoA thioesterase [Candidatus Eisenbacteria bacterium]